jgi:hypothetical protein
MSAAAAAFAGSGHGRPAVVMVDVRGDRRESVIEGNDEAGLKGSRGSDPRPLGLTMGGYLIAHSGGANPQISTPIGEIRTSALNLGQHPRPFRSRAKCAGLVATMAIATGPAAPLRKWQLPRSTTLRVPPGLRRAIKPRRANVRSCSAPPLPARHREF